MSTTQHSTTSRRTMLRLGAAAPVAYATSGVLATESSAAHTTGRSPAVADLERAYDTTVGLMATNLRTGRSVRHRAHRRFAICSVFKGLAAAAVLRDHDRHGETLDRRVFYPQRDVLEYAPVAGKDVRDGKTIRELCEAAVCLSDNTAGNLLLREIGGPRGLTAFARSLGDDVTRLDRWETALNSARPGDRRDTTSPYAIARTYARLLVGDALDRRDRELLRNWMFANQTSRLAPGLPGGWRLADKTGAGSYGSTNDVGVAWSPSGEPVVIAAMTRRDEEDAVTDDALLADLAALVAKRLG